MNLRDTSMVDGPRDFPTTMWTDILSLGDPSSPQYRDRMDHLCRMYWKPVYAYIRTAWRKTVEDAKDLAQAFFTHLLSKGYVAHLRPEKGSFRGYLKRALKHFLIDAKRHDSARQPDAPMFSLQSAPAEELSRLGPAAPDEPADRAYDRVWFHCLMETAVDILHVRLVREGKDRYFDVFKIYYVDEPSPSMNDSGSRILKEGLPSSLTYRDVAKTVGIRETDVGNYLTYCRETLREILRARIREYVGSDDEVDGELEEALNR